MSTVRPTRPRVVVKAATVVDVATAVILLAFAAAALLMIGIG